MLPIGYGEPCDRSGLERIVLIEYMILINIVKVVVLVSKLEDSCQERAVSISGATGLIAAAVVTLMAVACSSDEESRDTLYVAGIPDQNAANLARRYDALTEYLSDALGVNVEYVATVDYGATVTAFEQNGVQIGWFGGMTGVMARREVPGSEAIAQRL